MPPFAAMISPIGNPALENSPEKAFWPCPDMTPSETYSTICLSEELIVFTAMLTKAC